ncbi:MAG: tetratricopeptide repeat protein [Gammaproteobacteria bacterium]|nr:tetratricopeptide repeat protein [Gammaproteobacteria bacterium]MCP5196612.1 tetratricopeptide repeat protein [Gammaproteobacteria bacterium]
MGDPTRILWIILCSITLHGCAHLGPGGRAIDHLLDSPDSLDSAPETASLESPKSPLPSSAPADPANPAFIEARARQAYETGRWDVAEGYYLQLTLVKPGDAEPWFQLGNLYAEQGRLHSAERAYRESLRRRDDARFLHNLGLVQVKLGIGALRESQKRLPPDDPARQETREFLQTLLETGLL